jgi:hypothetical protein
MTTSMTTIRAVRRIVTALVPLAVWSCGDMTTVPDLSAGTPSELFATAIVSPNGINLAMSPAGYDTVRIHVSAYNAVGDEMDASGVTPRFTSLDTTRAVVDADGLITARRLANANDPVRVVASLTINGVTKWDTAFVRVVSSAPADTLGTFSIQPATEAAGVWPLGSFSSAIHATTEATNGTSYSDNQLLVAFRSSNARIVSFNGSGMTAAPQPLKDPLGNPQGTPVTPNAPGTVWMTGSTYAFGVSLSDSAQYRVDSLAEVRIIQVRQRQSSSGAMEYYFSPDTVRILSGQTVLWTTFPLPETADSTAITFSDTLAAQPVTSYPFFYYVAMAAGNIPAMPPHKQFGAGRSFLTPGTYTFSDGRGATGAIIVNGVSP